jgi:hypothetical protein
MLIQAPHTHKLDSTTHRTTYIIYAALRNALNYLDDNNLINFADFDGDGDGEIDAITFLHSGYGAETTGVDEYGTDYTDRIWYVSV